MPDNDEWPEPAPENKFDWSLSFQQIERKYGGVLKPPVFKIKRRKQQTVYITKQEGKYSDSRGFEKYLASKYPYVHELLKGANPDMPRWIYDNLIKNSSEQ